MRWQSLLLIPLFSLTLPAQSQQVLAALAAGGYFPLDVGNRWVFRIDDRGLTSAYQTWQVDRTEERNGKIWSVFKITGPREVSAESLFRADEQGRVYLYTGGGEKLFFDPSDASASLQVTGRSTSFRTLFGTLPDALFYQNNLNGLQIENGTLVRGIGVVASQTTMITGSSGGFFEGRTLVEASLAGGLQFSLNAPSVQLEIESLTLDVSGRKVTNCAVPCYFVACGLVPGADPPNTYKPCARTRIELQNWPAGTDRAVRLQLIGPDQAVAYERTVSGESVAFVQVPLYSVPNEPLAPGRYRLQASTNDATAAILVEIR